MKKNNNYFNLISMTTIIFLMIINKATINNSAIKLIIGIILVALGLSTVFYNVINSFKKV